MASGTIGGWTSNRYITSRIRWSATADSSTRKSTVTAYLDYRRTNSGYKTYGTIRGQLNINGAVSNFSNRVTISSGWVNVASFTTTVWHNGDGSKACWIGASGAISGTTLRSTSCGAVVYLDKIAAQSGATTSSGTVYGKDIQYYVHGASASDIFTLSFQPTVTISKLELNGDGVRVYYTSDLADGGCTVEAGTVGVTMTEKGKYGGSGDVFIPCKYLPRVPSGSREATCKLTKDVPSKTATATLAVTDAANRKTQEITYSESAYGTYLITIPNVNPETDTVQIFVSCGKVVADVHLKEVTSTYAQYECISPLNIETFVMTWVKRADGTWDAEEKNLAPIKDHSFVWTFDGGACVLDYGHSAPGATQDDTITKDFNEYKVIGREYKSYRAKKTKERSLNVTGVVSPLAPHHGAWDDFDALLEAGHATFRNSRGEVLPVFVSGITRPLKWEQFTEITVTQHQETR